MQTIPKKKIVIGIIFTIAWTLLFSIVVFWITKVQTGYEIVPFGSLLLWKIIAAFFTLYDLFVPWQWKKRFKSMSVKQNITPKRENSFLILFCFTPFIAPILFGGILVFLGIPFSEYLYFVGAFVLGILVWGTYNLRMSVSNDINI
jgi:hypothetical protein